MAIIELGDLQPPSLFKRLSLARTLHFVISRGISDEKSLHLQIVIDFSRWSK